MLRPIPLLLAAALLCPLAARDAAAQGSSSDVGAAPDATAPPDAPGLSHATVRPDVTAPPDFREEFLGQFDASARKLVALARAMPAETFDWRPMEGVASVADAFMHIARYNYYYPEVALGVEAPEDVEYERLQGVVTEKERVIPILEASMEHVRSHVQAMSPTDLEAPTRLYGREVAKWAVLLQLVTHMNEHLGQEIAYARMNRVVPPWSR
ncbi:MAG: hypothetical protein GWM92_15660 [Gemmatimonadetes bacterium]|nr:DinB family protein [Gemmatimonadota bacterium]NIR80168.1 DinB family protein [Gemmatimonadota bacterium]NIT88931.1 DinB family protein [Gemmatimonadota bacterium]NIU32724.1 DinB family protein [Gemmatimonadota bacterium]NIU37159.1 hypothetical protein [Gemmatimonadota bacterium]